MNARTIRTGLTLAVLGTAAIVVPAAPAGTADPAVPEVVGVWGDATGAWMAYESLEGEFGVGPAPQVVLPLDGSGGGPLTDSLASLVLATPVPLPVTGALEVSTQGATGADGFSLSSATVSDVNPTDNPSSLVTADAVDVNCSASLDGLAGSTTITGGAAFLPVSPTAIPESPLPDTVVWSGVVESPFGSGLLRATGEIVVNEQYQDASNIRVVGIRTDVLFEFVPADGDPVPLVEVHAVIGEASCGIGTDGPAPGPPGPGPTPSTPVDPVRATPRFTG